MLATLMSSTDPPLSPPSSASSAMSFTSAGEPFSCIRPRKYDEELWQACAGPLVSLPKLGQLVMYLPQGHIEQISASTNQGADCTELPKPDLAPHILCRVMDVRLSAEPETDEVNAQLSLLPQLEGSDSKAAVAAEELPSPSSKPTVHMLCKTLTASDTSTHGGFSVPRKHASCLPPLDMTQFPPTQELVATDLHGVKWHFRHIYRGQPKRHLLTTGWSVFVSQKRLLAGDAVIFLRGEDGELRVGIRRALRQQNPPSPSVLSSQSLQMGVIATATYAILARTIFCVYYKPRVSPAEFMIPLERFKSALSVNLAVGMRFKMKFETEDASERRYNGTITGIEDFDPSKWPSSKWRSLKVGWDELTIDELHDRISPWEIEVYVMNSVEPPNPAPGPRCKRVRANIPIPSQAAEQSLVSSGRSKVGFGSVLSAKCSTVLQGQNPRALGLTEDAYHGGYHALPSPCHQHLHSQANPLPLLQQSWSGNRQGNGEFFWGMAGQDGRGSYMFPSFVTSQQEESTTYPSSNSDSTPILRSNPRFSLHRSKLSSLPTAMEIEATNMSLQQSMQGQALPSNQSSYSSTWQKKGPQEAGTESAGAPMEAMETGEVHTGCKLFGFSLTNPPPFKPKAIMAMMTSAEKQQAADLDNIQLNGSEHEVEQPRKEASALDLSATSSESDSQRPATNDDILGEGQCRGQFAGRSCTKVVKKGSIIGRGVDLSKLGGYNQLFEELERMFHLEGQLQDKEKGWQVAYSDNENDMLEVGDDPWGEFRTMARKIHILSSQDSKGTSSPLNNYSP